ncbi:hypothetical protein D3C73_616130 [compost metagenome]
MAAAISAHRQSAVLPLPGFLQVSPVVAVKPCLQGNPVLLAGGNPEDNSLIRAACKQLAGILNLTHPIADPGNAACQIKLSPVVLGRLPVAAKR